MRAIFWILLILLLLFLLMTAPSLKRRRARAWRGTLFAHRGLHDETRAENSLAAFEAACRAGCGIELDVRYSKDGRLIVFHDDTLERMCGDKRRPEELTVAELKALPLGNTQDRIPTFDEALALIDGRAPLLVEIKNGRRIKALTADTAARLKRYKGKYLIESFNPLCLFYLRFMAGDVVRGQLVASREETMQTTGAALAIALSGLLLNALSRPDFVAYNIADPRGYAPAVQRRVYRTPMAAWTVRTPEQLALAKKRGDMVIFEKIRPES